MVNFKNSLYTYAMAAALISGVYVNIELWTANNRLNTILEKKADNGQTVGEMLDNIRKYKKEIEVNAIECERLSKENSDLLRNLNDNIK